jgi:hypothetical protein
VANTITVTYKVNEDGSLSKIAKGADKAAKSTDRATNSANNYNKAQKGVAQAGMNSTKAFSKMSGQMGGGNGLVAAYAGLAANIFALTAGFGALSRAAAATQLEEGLVEMGKASGLAMHTLSKGLVEATGHAISLEESMRSVALITSAGIDASKIEEFGEVARKASVALGRNLTDSMSRLTRGVTKLEPELLDELGIMVRLDEASKTYADSIGKSVSELSNFEKRQAFLNATLAEGEAKFGSLGNVDVNAFDKLSATFADLAKSGIGGIADMIKPIVNFLSEKPLALLSVLTLFASTISSQVLGSLGDMTQKTKDAALATADLNRKKIQDISHMNRSSKAMSNLVGKMKDGNAVNQDFVASIRGQNQSQKTNLGLLNKRNKLLAAGKPVVDDQGKALKNTGISQAEYNQRIKSSEGIIKRTTIAQSQNRQSNAQLSASKAQAALSEGRFGVALKHANRSLKLQVGALKIASTSMKSYAGAMNVASIAAKGLGMALKTLGAGVMKALGAIGMAIMVFQMLYDGVMLVINAMKSEAQKEYEKQTKALSDAQEELAGNLKEVDKGFTNHSVKIHSLSASYTAMNNTLSTFLKMYTELDAAGKVNNNSSSEQIAAMDELIKSSHFLTDAFEKQTGSTTVAGLALSKNKEDMLLAKDIGADFIKTQNAIAAGVRAAGEAFKASKTAVSEFFTAMESKTTVDDLVSTTADLVKTLGTLDSSVDMSTFLSQSLSADQVVLFDVAGEKSRLDEITKHTTRQRKILGELQDDLAFAEDNISISAKGRRHKREAEDIRAAIVVIKQMIAEKEKEGKADIDSTKQKIGAQDIAFKAEKERQILSKANIETAKNGLSIEKAKAITSQASLTRTIELEGKLLAVQDANLRGQQKFIFDQMAGLKSKEAAKTLTADEAEKLKILRAEHTRIGSQLALINVHKAGAVKLADDQLRIAKMEVAVITNKQKGERALLSLQSTQNKAAIKALDVAEKRAMLTQRQANKGAGLGGKQLAEDTIRIQKAGLQDRLTASKEEERIKIATAKLDHTLLKARLSIIQKEIELHNSKLAEGETAIPTVEIESALSMLGDTSVITQQIAADYELQRDLLTEQVNMLDENIVRQVRLTKESIKLQDIRKNALNEQKNLNSELGRQSEILNEQAKIANTKADGSPKNAIEAAKLEEQGRILRIQAMDREFVLKKQIIASETALLEAKFSLLSAEMAKDELTTQEIAVLAETRKVLDLQKEVNSQRIKTAEMELQLTKDKMDLESRSGIDKAAKEGGLSGAVKEFEGQRAARNAAAEATKKAGDQAREAAKEAGKSDEEIEAAVKDAKAQASKNATTAITLATTQLQALQQAVALLQQIASCSCKAGAPSGGTTRDTGTEEGSTTDGKIEKPLKYQDDDSLPGSTVIAGKGDPLTIGGEAVESGTTVDTGTITPPKPTIDTGTGNEDTSTDVDPKPKMSKEEAGVLARATLSGFASDFAKLGPEGEAVSAAIDGSMAIFDAFKNMGEGVQGKLQAAGAIIGAISQMAAASSKAKIAGIDKEIQAEKKRDGQSSASVGKIKALEAKKEAMKKKAFETDKKMKMAQAVIGIAQGVTSALGAPFPLNFILPALVLAMGAKQLQMISSTQYQSSSASTASADMPSISLGSRSNTVDLAKGNNQAGETAYMRGASGQGGMQNFTPAFTGYKNRASGGNTGFIVGEQGPELFTPSIPGDITSADETADMEAATPTNVTFNISAIDASGVEDMLTVQRGNIIRMIRDAANEQGQLFLEAVEESKL